MLKQSVDAHKYKLTHTITFCVRNADMSYSTYELCLFKYKIQLRSGQLILSVFKMSMSFIITSYFGRNNMTQKQTCCSTRRANFELLAENISVFLLSPEFMQHINIYETKVCSSTQDKRDKDENNFTRRSQESCPNLCSVQNKTYRYVLFSTPSLNSNNIYTRQTELYKMNSLGNKRIKIRI